MSKEKLQLYLIVSLLLFIAGQFLYNQFSADDSSIVNQLKNEKQKRENSELRVEKLIDSIQSINSKINSFYVHRDSVKNARDTITNEIKSYDKKISKVDSSVLNYNSDSIFDFFSEYDFKYSD